MTSVHVHQIVKTGNNQEHSKRVSRRLDAHRDASITQCNIDKRIKLHKLEPCRHVRVTFDQKVNQHIVCNGVVEAGRHADPEGSVVRPKDPDLRLIVGAEGVFGCGR
jgi:hypothetical protein